MTKAISPSFSVSIAAAQGTFPAWRQNRPVGQFFEIPNTANMAGSTETAAVMVDAWNGLAVSDTSVFLALPSGDGSYDNGCHKFDLSVDSPKWQTLDVGTRTCSDGSPLPDTQPVLGVGKGVNQQYYWDGRPCGTHTYDQIKFISAARDKFGRDRLMRFGSMFPGGIYYPEPPPAPQYSNLTVDGFDLAANKYDPIGTWAKLPGLIDVQGSGAIRSVIKHPITEEVYLCVGGALMKWTPQTDTYAEVPISPPRGTSIYANPPGLFDWHQQPALIDVARNQLVCIYDWHLTSPGSAPQIQKVDLATGVVTTGTLTGAIPTNFLQSSVQHDLDADRYLLMDFTSGVYAIDPSTNGVTLIAVPPTTPLYTWAGRMAYFKKFGGVLCMSRYAANLSFMPTR